ncbi:putative ABC transport system ATP-binding protein [Evansella vedderi]|uniref:ABC transport system ATP-binding protein n=1 Tax=Evansella vedderi TaxID=38282 RepID=A0ABT9ZYU7_9BACI|nr:ABC transporter ATP-binding protein [Evansella vedderi]MDQ0255280.1 putative ABC transport system ATP-binding protein [Evansella vedderi]
MFQLNEVQVGNILFINKLHIPDKRITCIMGESGGGKSTLIKLLNNFIPYDHGKITYNGEDLQLIDPILLRRNVVMVSQVPVMFEGTVQDNLLIGLTFSEKSTPKVEKLQKILSIVCLPKELDVDAEELSGGEKQRLSLARALLMEPEVYIFDEPTSALDEELEDKVMGNIIEEIKRREKTLIMVTHSKKLAATFGEVIVHLKGGKITKVREVTTNG